jgi:hypothetical protein
MNVPIKHASPKKSKGEKKNSNIEIRGTVKQKLKVTINEAAVQKKQKRIVNALTERVEQQELMRPHQQMVKNLTEEIETLRAEAKAYEEEREVTCQVEFDHAHREVRYRRMDTGKIVDSLSRSMTDEDTDMPKKVVKPADGPPALTPAAAIAKARQESDAGEKNDGGENADQPSGTA